MRIKSKRIDKENNAEISYPCLMINSRKDVVVLFKAARTGAIVSSPDDDTYRVGGYSGTWSMHGFTPYHGTIELSNDFQGDGGDE